MTEPLELLKWFPPTPTEAWEAQIKTDLKGADYEKKLVWRTEEGIAVRPYYRRENLAGLEYQTHTAPGEYPFVRGARGWEMVSTLTLPESSIRADQFHEAGATAVQELAYALAAAVEKYPEAPEFVFSIGSSYFIEIAKLRAARMLWARAASAFDASVDVPAKIHARTALANKSAYDAYTNLLRVTTEAMSAVIGGCDSLEVRAFGFNEHLAVNLQLILKEEAHLDAVADPAGGSYYIETLTDALAREAWKLFQTVECEGGFHAAMQSGTIAAAIASSRAAKEKAVASRRRVMVGVNNYPDLKDKGRAEVAALESNGDFPAFRLSAAFEKIRERTAKASRVPKVLLLKSGDVKMRMARAQFALNFFGCAGFDVVESDHLEEADLIVLCSSDAEYLPLAQEVCVKAAAPVLVAGNPKEQIPALEAAGVAGFVHIMSNAVDTLTEWQIRLGLPS